MTESSSGVVSLGDLLRVNPKPPACLIEPGLLPQQGILFCGGEPKVGKSLLVANLALTLAAGSSRTGFHVPTPRRVLICQFELPTEQFAARLWLMRHALGPGADDNLFVDTRSAGHLLSSSHGLNHFLAAARAAAAEAIILDPLYSAHDQDENDTRAMAALCQTLLRLRDASRAALIVVHHIRKSVGRYEIGSAFRGSSALHAVGDSYMLLTRPSPQLNTIELRFQFRYAAPQPPMLLRLDPISLWFASSDQAPQSSESRRKVETTDVQQALVSIGSAAGYNELRSRIMTLTTCSKRTAQMAINRACEEKTILRDNGRYRLAL
jgi:AAA domain